VGGAFAFALGALGLLVGWGWAAGLRRRPAAPSLWLVVLAALGVTGGWLVSLGLLGLSWNGLLSLLPCLGGVLLAWKNRGLLARQVEQHPWAFFATLFGLLTCLLPAWGWDFRYQWGLKAKVFSLFGGHAPSFLAWPEVAFAHPAYPPLWPDGLALAMNLGASVQSAASTWTALLRLGLAAACWSLAKDAAPFWRALAAVSAFFAPVIFRPSFSGYAEPLLAFLLACTVLAAEAGPSSSLALAGSLLGLAKAEGTLWLASLGMVFLLAKGKHLAKCLGLCWVPAGLWYLWVWGKTGLPQSQGASHFWLRLGEFPQAFVAAGPEVALTTLACLGAVALAWGKTPLAPATLFFLVGLVGVYLLGPHPLTWWLANSWNRVVMVPTPALLAAAMRRQDP